jgi:hypothetical protein
VSSENYENKALHDDTSFRCLSGLIVYRLYFAIQERAEQAVTSDANFIPADALCVRLLSAIGRRAERKRS